MNIKKTNYYVWKDLGGLYLERGSIVGIIDPGLLPVECEEYDDEFIEDYFINYGGGSIGAQANYIFLKHDQDQNFKELRLIEEPGIDFEEYLQENSKINYEYFDYEKHHIFDYENNQIYEGLYSESNHAYSFKVSSGKMLVFNALYHAWDPKYLKLKRKEVINGNPNILQVNNISWGYKDDYLIKCKNGTYDVFALSTAIKKRIVLREHVSIELNCCSTVLPYDENKIINKWGVEWIHCDKCNKLTGGYDGIKRLDKDGKLIDFRSKIFTDTKSKDVISNLFCWVIKYRDEKNTKDLKADFELFSQDNFAIPYGEDTRYIGKLKNGIPDGKGRLISQTKIEEGEFKNGLKHGIIHVFDTNKEKFNYENYFEGKKLPDSSNKIQ